MLSQGYCFAVTGEKQAYLNYLKSFSDIVFIARAADFQDFTLEIIPSFYSDALNDDVFIPLINLNFINYISLYSDFYILKRELSSS